MTLLTKAMYLLSTGMLIPVVLLLLGLFVWSLVALGELYGFYFANLRVRVAKDRLQRASRAAGQPALDVLPELPPQNRLRLAIEAMAAVQWHPAHGDHILAQYELASRRLLDAPMLLLRLGPMLGLMGTLIPMGPALIGLAAGDILTMANNLQVAFSTTVIGIFIGGAGFLVQLLKRRWLQGDLDLLNYLLALTSYKEASDASS